MSELCDVLFGRDHGVAAGDMCSAARYSSTVALAHAALEPSLDHTRASYAVSGRSSATGTYTSLELVCCRKDPRMGLQRTGDVGKSKTSRLNIRSEAVCVEGRVRSTAVSRSRTSRPLTPQPYCERAVLKRLPQRGALSCLLYAAGCLAGVCAVAVVAAAAAPPAAGGNTSS